VRFKTTWQLLRCARRRPQITPHLPLAPLTAGTKGGLNKPKKNVLSSRDPNSVSIALQAGVTKSQSSGAAADTAQRLANRALPFRDKCNPLLSCPPFSSEFSMLQLETEEGARAD
jgi:hypothetical protein